MSKTPAASYSPFDGPPLASSNAPPASRSPPAMVSIASGLRHFDSRSAGVASVFGLRSSAISTNDLESDYDYSASGHIMANSRSGPGPRSSVTRAPALSRSSGHSLDKLDPFSSSGGFKPQAPYYLQDGAVSVTSHDLVRFGDVSEGPDSSGLPSRNSFARPSSLAPTARGTANTASTASAASEGSTGPVSARRLAAAAPPAAMGLRESGVDGVGVPLEMLPNPRCAQPPPTPQSPMPNPRQGSTSTTPSMSGPGSIRPDSILMSSSQVPNVGSTSPSRDNVAKRATRLAGRIEIDTDSATPSTTTASVSRSGPVWGSISPSAPLQSRKRMAGSPEGSQDSNRQTTNAGTPSTTTTASSGNRQTMRVNIAQKALIGMGSYGKVFKAMDRDTNRIIAVKEIALNGASTRRGGNANANDTAGSDAAVARNSTDTKRLAIADDVVMGSPNGVSVSPASVPNNINTNSMSTRSPTKAPHPAEFQRQLDAVRKELAVLNQLDHPNIVKCLGEDCDDSYLRIYMEYVAGGSVTTLLRTFGVFQELQAARLTRQMLLGLAYLHSKGIVHRDLKGDNLLIETDGDLKLADFGTARDVQAQTHTNAIVGTAYFIAPEVVTGKGLSTKSDIWSVGCCVIEMLTGAPPLSDMKNQYSIMMFIASAKDDLLSRYIPAHNDWSEDVLDFLRRCLNRNPEKRPTAKQLLTHPWVARDACVPLPSPPVNDRARSSGGSTYSAATAEAEPLATPSSHDRGGKKSNKSKKDKHCKRSTSRQRRKLCEYALDANEFTFGAQPPIADDCASPNLGPNLISPRCGGRLVRLGGGGSPQENVNHASSDSDRLPDIRAHSMTASLRSPCLPSLTSEKSPSSAHATAKSTTSSQRGPFSMAVGLTRRQNVKAPPVLASPLDFIGGCKVSSYLSKSPCDSKDGYTPLKGAKIMGGSSSRDDVLSGRDDLSYQFSSTRSSPQSQQRKLKNTASPRMPPLASPPSRNLNRK